MSLTEGALAKIMRGEDIGDFTVQVNYCDVSYIVSAHYESVIRYRYMSYYISKKILGHRRYLDRGILHFDYHPHLKITFSSFPPSQTPMYFA